MGCIPVSAQKKLLGGDISLLPSYIEKGTEFRTESGRLIKRPLRFFRQQGWNAMRVSCGFSWIPKKHRRPTRAKAFAKTSTT